MAVFQVGKDYETSERAGAGGMYQVDTLIDENGTDVTDRIDVGRHYNSDEDLKNDLSDIFGIPVEEIHIDEL